MADDLEDTIRENAQGPKSVSNDSGSATAQSLAEQIEADRYLKGSAVARKGRGLGIRHVKLIPPGGGD
jgi:hypothetical protein